MRSRLSAFLVLLGLASITVGTGCGSASSEGADAVTGDEQNLTQARIAKNASAAIERLRADFESTANAQAESDKEGFFGYARAFKWGTNHALENGLSAEQKSFLGTELVQAIEDVPDRLPNGAELSAVDVTRGEGIAAAELRLAPEKAGGIDQDLAGVLADGHLVMRLEPAVAAPGAERTAGAIMVVDLEKREALVLYGRSGPAPFHAECTVTEMVSYQWDEALSKEEYPSVDVAEIPLFGDVLLDIGVNATLSNADAQREGDDYRVTLTKTGSTVEIVAKSPTQFWAKLVVDGTTGAVYGDSDGNGRANKAAELACKVSH